MNLPALMERSACDIELQRVDIFQPHQTKSTVPVHDSLSCARAPGRVQKPAPHCSHAVQFYENDRGLAESVSKFISEGLRQGEGAILIATADHRRIIAQNLSEHGINLATFEASGHYVTFDAAEMLRKIMTGDSLDPALFQKVIGGTIEQMAKGRRGVRAFGEMVALLWAEGNRAAAIQLEELWNALGKTHSFCLFCAYPLQQFENAGDSSEFAQICQSHSSVLPSEGFLEQSEPDRLREIALLQQKAAALEKEICQRQQVEEKLRNREAELTCFVENASIGLHWVGPDGMIKWANKAEYEMLGYPAEEYIGHHIAAFHADQPVIEDILSRLKNGQCLHDFEARLKCRDGSIKTVLIDSTGLWENGRFVHTQCFTRDITEQKRAQESVARLAAIIESSDDAIFSTDLEGVITSWNRGAQALYGYPEQEVLGQSLVMLVPEGKEPEEADILQRLRRGEIIENMETLRRRKDGTLFHASLTVSPVRDPHGKIIGISKVARDITAKVQAREILEQTVAERTASLREVIAQMEEFSYSVSHDLRAPLRAMDAYAAALLEDYGDHLDVTARGYLEKIQRSSKRMDQLTQDVLTYSRLARNQTPCAPIAVEKLIKDVIVQYGDLQPPAVKIQILTPLLDVLGHEPSFGQCVANLLNNAVKFIHPGTQPCVRVRTERLGKNVRIWFEDNGIGIKPEHHGRIFQMFEQVHPPGKYSGTGIGLTIVRKAVEKMGGKVGVDSDGHNGSRFWILLPAAKEA